MELRDLFLFVAVAEELSFSRAASRLHITQPGLSQRIKILERHLGVKLFERSKQQVSLTEPGHELLPVVRRLLDQAGQVQNLADYLARINKGALALAHTRSAGLGLAGRLVAEFRRCRPHVDVQTSMGATAVNTERVLAKEIDVAFARACEDQAGELACLTVGSDPVVVALPADHPLTGQPVIAHGDIAGELLVFFDEKYAPGMWRLVLDSVFGASDEHKVAHVEPEESLMLAAVANGEGISLITHPVASLMDVPGVVMKPLQPTVNVPLDLIWRPDNTNPSLSAFIELARTFDNPHPEAKLPTAPSA